MPTYAAESPRLWLQTIHIEEHLHDHHLIQSHPLVMMWSTKNPSTSLEQTKAFMSENMPSTDKPWNERWAIILRPEPDSEDKQAPSRNSSIKPGEKLKMIGLIGIVREQELGYKMHPDFWRKGYMTEALIMMSNLFWEMEINAKHDKLTAYADPENLGSIRVLEKVGFQKGEYRSNTYQRAYKVRRGDESFSDLQGFFVTRPTLATTSKEAFTT